MSSTPDTSGVPITVSLIADPFAYCFANASQMGDLPVPQGRINPLMASFAGSADLSFKGAFGDVRYPNFYLYILNSLKDSLHQVEVYKSARLVQYAYPVSPAPPGSTTATDAHAILGARPYPSPSKRLMANGSPAMMGGFGMYAFDADTNGGYPFGFAMSFSRADDGSDPKCAIAVGFPALGLNLPPTLAVCADLTAANYSSLSDFWTQTIGADGASVKVRQAYDTGTAMTIWAAWDRDFSQYTSNSLPEAALTVWLHDSGSTLGLGPK
jgi:hypothetical protein